ncbi:MAG: hypothetical protein RLZZ215_1226, partial [Pseudomonadota bacterium]
KGMIPALLPPGSWQDAEPRMDPVPALGEHSEAILSALGCTPDKIHELRQAGVI